MERIRILTLLLSLLNGVASSQALYLGGGNINVSAGGALYVNNNLDVESGSLTVRSDSSYSGSLLVTGTSVGNIIYDRYIDDTFWHFISAPVSTQDIASFVQDTANAIAFNPYSGAYAVSVYNNSWEYYDTATVASEGNFIPAKGYSVLRTSPGSFTFEGNLSTSDVAIALSTESGTDYWDCIGNPYPSFLMGVDGPDINSVFKENIDKLDDSYKALYLWNDSVYQAINYASGTVYLRPGQAFMVKATSTNETFNFSEALQSHQSGVTSFYRMGSTPTIELFVNNGSTERNTTLKYYENATLGLDPGYDAAALFLDGIPEFSLNTHLVADSEGLNFTLQCLPNSDYEASIVPIAVYAQAGATLNFSSLHSGDLPEELHIYLKDVVNNQITDLKVENYEITLPDTLQGIGQFYLHITAEELNITIQEELTDISMYSPASSNLVIYGMQGNNKAHIKLYNPLGQLVYTHSFKATPKVSLILPNIPTGVYIADLQTQFGLHSQKIILNK